MFSLCDSPIDTARLLRFLADDSAGAVACFEGRVRDHNEGRPVTGLEYEAYAALAEKEGRRILAEAVARFDILGASCSHRTGALAVGELAVWVGVAAAHRGAAFDACRYIIDEIKARLPIWKKEHYADGSRTWVNCQTCSEHRGSAPAAVSEVEA